MKPLGERLRQVLAAAVDLVDAEEAVGSCECGAVTSIEEYDSGQCAACGGIVDEKEALVPVVLPGPSP